MELQGARGEKHKQLLFEAGTDLGGNRLTDFCGGCSFGWMLKKHCGEEVLWHTGGNAGFRTLIMRFYKSQFSVILLSNTSDFDWQTAYGMLSKLYHAYC